MEKAPTVSKARAVSIGPTRTMPLVFLDGAVIRVCDDCLSLLGTARPRPGCEPNGELDDGEVVLTHLLQPGAAERVRERPGP
jgi:hypothetical protein